MWHNFMGEHLMKAGLISEEDFAFFRITDDIEVAVEEVLQFYRVYHSSRYVGDRFVIRMKARLSCIPSPLETNSMRGGEAMSCAPPGPAFSSTPS